MLTNALMNNTALTSLDLSGYAQRAGDDDDDFHWNIGNCGVQIMKLGEIQKLKIEKKVEFGVYLSDGTDRVLLPKKQ